MGGGSTEGKQSNGHCCIEAVALYVYCGAGEYKKDAVTFTRGSTHLMAAERTSGLSQSMLEYEV